MERVVVLEKETYEQASARLGGELRDVAPGELAEFLSRHAGEMAAGPRPFAEYMRRKLREKGRLRQDVFLAADLSENYGYKLLSEEKHTRRRDTILRLCLGARFRPEEVNEALILYGMAPLYGRFPRDAVLLSALYHGIYELREVNRLLESLGLPLLVEGYE